MEEILASIRKIISEDAGEEPAVDHGGDVLDLTHEVHDNAPAAEHPVTTEAATVAQTESQSEDSVSEHASQPVPIEDPNVSATASEHDGIFSEKSRKAIDDAFAGLERLDETRESNTQRTASMPAVEGSSIEAVFERAVRSSVDPVLQHWMESNRDNLLNAVKPLIREWMDEHFPALLEGAVREEVARVVRARGR